MSLEAALQENTAVMRELIAVLKSEGSAKPAKSEKPTKAEQSKPEPEKAPEPAKQETKAEPPKAETADLRPKAQKAIQELAKAKGRDAAIGAIQKVVATAGAVSAVPDDKLGELIDAAEAAMLA